MGHDNYGGADIFYTKRLDSTWTNWSEPQNLGPDVNSKEFEAYYTIPANGSIGYYVSSNGGRKGSRDIFSITIPYQFRPEPVILLKGKFLADQGDQDSSNYHVTFLTSSENESEVNIEYEATHFNAILPTGGSYFFYVDKNGYISESHYIDLTNRKEYLEESADIHTVPIKEGAITTSHNIQFLEKTSDLFPSSYFELVRLLEIFKQYDSLQLELIGHAHDFEDSLKNWMLSKERLIKIRDFYVEQGFHHDRFILSPKGDCELNTDGYKKHVNAQFDINSRIDFKINDLEWIPPVLLSKNELATTQKTLEVSFNKSEELKYSIFFGFDDAEIKDQDETLVQLIDQISSRAPSSIKLIGYTCNIGSASYNQYLAEQRANSVKKWLLKQGLNKVDISVIAKGESQPVADNNDLEQRKLNRRVEVIFNSISTNSQSVSGH
jgi:outer membrane protein OmpA-like peptidoglycan-associated protein